MTYEEKSAIVISQLRADRDRLQDTLNKIRAEIEAYQSDAFYPDDVMINKKMVLEIIDRFKVVADIDHTCHTCKHYLSGEHDGSCGSYICKNYSGWEDKEQES